MLGVLQVNVTRFILDVIASSLLSYFIDKTTKKCILPSDKFAIKWCSVFKDLKSTNATKVVIEFIKLLELYQFNVNKHCKMLAIFMGSRFTSDDKNLSQLLNFTILKTTVSRTTIESIVKLGASLSQYHSASSENLLKIMADVWSDKSFISCSSLEYQLQIATAICALLRLRPKLDVTGVTSRFQKCTGTYLGALRSETRELGMVVAEYFSTVNSTILLDFEIESQFDWLKNDFDHDQVTPIFVIKKIESDETPAIVITTEADSDDEPDENYDEVLKSNRPNKSTPRYLGQIFTELKQENYDKIKFALLALPQLIQRASKLELGIEYLMLMK